MLNGKSITKIKIKKIYQIFIVITFIISKFNQEDIEKKNNSSISYGSLSKDFEQTQILGDSKHQRNIDKVIIYYVLVL